jgi:hypothetical protein
VANTIGIAFVTSRAAATSVEEGAKMTSTLRRTNSAASGGNCSIFSVRRTSITILWPSKWPSSRKPTRNASIRLAQAETVAKGQEAHVPHLIALLRPRRERPRRRDAEQRNKLAASQLVELHSIPARQGRIAGYPIGEDQSGGNERGSVASPENQLRSASS